MIPKVAKSGHSFKGAAAYYLHDKTQDNAFNQASGAKAQTADRVEWTETRNLATDNPDLAWKIMAASANDGDFLKQQQREAEGKRAQSSGESNGKSVYAYSLAWSPEEQGKITREEMTTAAEDTLERLGFKDHQAMIVCHNDTDHPHVHVLVNKVNPETGKMQNPYRDFNKLDKWAREYRQDRGEEHYCPNREQKWKNHDEGQSNKNREKQTNTRLDSDQQATISADDPRAKKVHDAQKRGGERLSNYGKAMKSKHDEQWTQFKAKNKADKSAVFDRYKEPMNAARDKLNTAKKDHGKTKEHYKDLTDKRVKEIEDKHAPARSRLGKQQWKAKRSWESHEGTLQGRIGHAISAAIINRKEAPEQSKGFVKDAAKMLFNTPERKAAFERAQKAQWRELNKTMRQEVNKAKTEIRMQAKTAGAGSVEAMGAAVADMKTLNNHRSGELAALKATQQSDYNALKGSQTNDRQKLQAAWGNMKTRRNEALKRLAIKIKETVNQNHATSATFKEAAKAEATDDTKKTRTRTRSKTRKPRSRGRTQKLER